MEIFFQEESVASPRHAEGECWNNDVESFILYLACSWTCSSSSWLMIGYAFL